MPGVASMLRLGNLFEFGRKPGEGAAHWVRTMASGLRSPNRSCRIEFAVPASPASIKTQPGLPGFAQHPAAIGHRRRPAHDRRHLFGRAFLSNRSDYLYAGPAERPMRLKIIAAGQKPVNPD